MPVPPKSKSQQQSYRIKLCLSSQGSTCYTAGITLCKANGEHLAKVGTCVLDVTPKLRVFLETLEANGVEIECPAYINLNPQISEKKSSPLQRPVRKLIVSKPIRKRS